MCAERKLNRSLVLLAGAVLLYLGWASPRDAAAQDKPDKGKDQTPHAQHPDKPSGDQDLASQVVELRAKVAKLESMLAPMPARGGMGQGTMGPMSGNGGMGKMPGAPGGQAKPGMPGMDDMMGGKQGMGGGGMAGGGMSMEGGDGAMEMMQMMGKGPGAMGGMKAVSALPGFPGASHLYHVGATGFFLDHPEHLALSPEQQTALNGVKERALLDQSASRRGIEAAEQELWRLTSAAEPDAQKVEAKVREIEKLRGDERLAFIRAVGDAAKVLTDDQRRTLLGAASPPPAQSK